MLRGISLTQDFRELLLEKGFISDYVENLNSSFLLDFGSTSPTILISYFNSKELSGKDMHDLYLESCIKRFNVNRRLNHFEFHVSKSRQDINSADDYAIIYYKCVNYNDSSAQVFGECERYHKGNKITLTRTGKFEINSSINMNDMISRFINNAYKYSQNKITAISELECFYVQVKDGREDATEVLDKLVELSRNIYSEVDIAISYNEKHADELSNINCIGFAYDVSTWVKPPFRQLDLEKYYNNVTLLYDFSKDDNIQKILVRILEDTLKAYDKAVYCRIVHSLFEVGQDETLTLLYIEEGGGEYHAIRYENGHWVHKLGDDPVYYIPTEMNPLETNIWASDAHYYACDAVPIMVATGHNQILNFN